MRGVYIGNAICLAGAALGIGAGILTLNPWIGGGGFAFGVGCAAYVNAKADKALNICRANLQSCVGNNTSSYEEEVDPHYLLHDLTYYYDTTCWPEVYSVDAFYSGQFTATYYQDAAGHIYYY